MLHVGACGICPRARSARQYSTTCCTFLPLFSLVQASQCVNTTTSRVHTHMLKCTHTHVQHPRHASVPGGAYTLAQKLARNHVPCLHNRDTIVIRDSFWHLGAQIPISSYFNHFNPCTSSNL